jgi:hypothetical protein
MRRVALLLVGLAIALSGCEQKEKKTLVIGKKAIDCSLNVDSLVGTDWQMLEILPDKTEKASYSARIRFYSEDGKTMAKYNVKSFSDMYTYECFKNEATGELACKEEPKVKDWCQSLEVGGTPCNAESIKKIDKDVPEAKVTAGIKAAQETIAKYKGKPDWDKFVANNNNLGNKLQGRMYAKVDSRNCRLQITDNYMTIYNGKELEDSNPVGTNPFVPLEDEVLWEHCADATSLMALTERDFPKKPAKTRTTIQHALGAEVHFWLLHPDNLKAKKDCTYSYDVWVDGKPAKKAGTPEVAKGGKELRYYYGQKFDDAGVHVTSFVRFEECAGKKELSSVSCNLVKVQ